MDEPVRIEDLSKIEKKIYITVDSSTVNERFNDFFENVKKQAQLPGFRKGKAPVNLLKERFKNDARGAISQMLISEYYQSAIKDYNINPIGNPVIKAKEGEKTNKKKYLGEFHDDNSYSVELTIEVLPTIDPVGFEDLELDMPEHDIDELIEAKISDYQSQFAEREQIKDGAALVGDTVVIDYEGFVDQKPFDKGEGLAIDNLCGGTLAPGFEEQLVGLKDGESKKVFITFPEGYRTAHLAGKDAEFNVKIHSIVRKTPAPLDDELAMMVGFTSVDEFKDSIEKEIIKEIKNADRRILEGTIVKTLIEKNDFDVPQSLVKDEANRILKHNDIKNPSEKILETVKTAAINNVKKALLLDAIFEKEGLEVSPENLKVYLDKESEASGKTTDEIVSTLYNTNQMDNFVSIVRMNETIDHLINLNTKESEKDDE